MRQIMSVIDTDVSESLLKA